MISIVTAGRKAFGGLSRANIVDSSQLDVDEIEKYPGMSNSDAAYRLN